MPRNAGPGWSRLLLVLLGLVLLFGFTPISKALLDSVHGSFTPTPYSSLALRTPSAAQSGFVVGEPVDVRLTNRTGRLETYHWNATQKSGLISLGEETLSNGGSANITIPTQGAVAGTLRIGLSGTAIFLTVPLLKP
jgi:hypothetical protein